MRMRHVVICDLSGLQYFSTLSHKRRDFRKKEIIEHKIHALIFSATFVGKFSHSRKNWARYGLICIFVFVKSTHYYRQIVMKREFSRQIFEKYSNIKFHENPLLQADERTDMTKVIVAFRNFAKAPKNKYSYKNMTVKDVKRWDVCR